MSGPKVELNDKAGRSLQAKVYSNADARVVFNGDWPTVLILPEKQLDESGEYTVKIACTLSTFPFEKSWSFRTRSK